MHMRSWLSLAAALAVLAVGAVYISSKIDSDGSIDPTQDIAAIEAVYSDILTPVAPPAPTVPVTAEGITVPIVVYHIVRPSYPSDNAAVRKLALTPETFDAQMKYLGDAKYNIINFSDVENYFKNGTPLPANPIIISFDDGWSNQYRYAFPILKKYQYPATFFVFTNAIDKKGFFTWDQLHELMNAGMTIGSHSLSHPFLTKIKSEAVLWDEIYGSKQILEQKLGIKVNDFAYPFGQFNALATALVERAGYLSSRGDYMTKDRAFTRPFEISAINSPTTLEQFKLKFPPN